MIQQRHQQQCHQQRILQEQLQLGNATWNGLETILVMISTIIWNVAMMVEIVVERMYTQIFAKYVSAWIPMVVILLQVDLRLQQVRQVFLLKVATQHGVLMDIVMVSITTWTATMMVETVADAMSKYYTVACWKIAIVLIPIIVTQIAHKQQHQQDLLFLDPLVS